MTMQVEYFIYMYGAVCLSMIAFNLVYAVMLRGSEPRTRRRIQKLRARVDGQLARLQRSQPLDPKALEALGHRLRRVRNLVAFDRMLEALDGENAELKRDFVVRLQPVFLYLSHIYARRENTQAAYFSFFLSRYMVSSSDCAQALEQALLAYMGRANLYCQINALQTLCSCGSPENILAAVELQDRSDTFLHEKILTESLLGYPGDPHALIAGLWAQLDRFSPHTRLGILNYIRFCSGDYAGEMLALMRDVRQDKELRLAAIRYMGRYPHPPALDALLDFVEDADPRHWEYATVAASALAGYRDARVVPALKRALHSSNWYVRYAAADSLEALQVDYEDMIDLITGSDRYAREMILYRLERRRLKKGGE